MIENGIKKNGEAKTENKPKVSSNKRYGHTCSSQASQRADRIVRVKGWGTMVTKTRSSRVQLDSWSRWGGALTRVFVGIVMYDSS